KAISYHPHPDIPLASGFGFGEEYRFKTTCFSLALQHPDDKNLLWAGWLLGTQNYARDLATVRVPEPQAANAEARPAPYPHLLGRGYPISWRGPNSECAGETCACQVYRPQQVSPPALG